MTAALKRLLFRLLGKDPEAVVVSFATGDRALVDKMVAEVSSLVPGRRHFVVPPQEGSAWQIYRRLRREFRRYRIGLAPVLFAGGPSALRRAAFLLAPRKILAYNGALERHHLRPRCWIASLLFLRGVPLDRIWLRPLWLAPWKQDRSVYPADARVFTGRPLSAERRRVAVLSPYFPYPLAHGGAVRIFHLLRETAREFDVFLFAFDEGAAVGEIAKMAEFCARIVLVAKPRYREPRWSTLLPPEVCEYRTEAMRRALDDARREFHFEALQTEYTFLAPYGGDILVEHDVTFDLYGQVARRSRTLAARWDFRRWLRFETRMVRRFPHVVVMSAKDRKLLGGRAAVIENGVDLDRFRPEPERPGSRLLFIGSFRHFPNVEAYRFLMEQVWPWLAADISLTVVARTRPRAVLPRHSAPRRARHDARLRGRREAPVRGSEYRRRADHGIGGHQRQGARSHGDGAGGGIDHERLCGPRPGTRQERVDRRRCAELRLRHHTAGRIA